ncbi:hypothetical protein KY290_021948 [Solanum tuberosum]|uniref:Uncharacterized protein n=1 Tax=Solanum tuberosum TaxID=4113 RepID=A0ABQ7V622_SOLTU|nr:hypothetical protein KY289_021110 [Solanum tuberosum]KAH0758455.1 hypothetical protein KY290_021948 [Solanum tuberosum]
MAIMKKLKMIKKMRRKVKKKVRKEMKRKEMKMKVMKEMILKSEEGDEDVVKTFNIDKTILMDEKLENFFKSSYFGYFLDLSERRIKYKGDDDEAFENKNKKMDEI